MIYGQFAKQMVAPIAPTMHYRDYIPDFSIGPCLALEQAFEYNRLLSESFSYDEAKLEAVNILYEAGIGSIFEAIKEALRKLRDFVLKIVRNTVAFLTGLFSGKGGGSSSDSKSDSSDSTSQTSGGSSSSTSSDNKSSNGGSTNSTSSTDNKSTNNGTSSSTSSSNNKSQSSGSSNTGSSSSTSTNEKPKTKTNWPPEKPGTLPAYNEKAMSETVSRVVESKGLPVIYKPGAWKCLVKTDIRGSEKTVKDCLDWFTRTSDKVMSQSAEDTANMDEQLTQELMKLSLDLSKEIFTPVCVKESMALVGGEDATVEEMVKAVEMFENDTNEANEKRVKDFLKKCGVVFAILDGRDNRAAYEVMNSYNKKDLEDSCKSIRSLGDQAQKISDSLIPGFDKTLKSLQKKYHPDNNNGKEMSENGKTVYGNIAKVRKVCNNFTKYVTVAVIKACQVERINAGIIERMIKTYSAEAA